MLSCEIEPSPASGCRSQYCPEPTLKKVTDLPMYKRMVQRLSCALLPLVFLFLASSCGRVAPVHEPGQIQVTSTPPGAVIILDGINTGQITPATIGDLPPGHYVVSVQLDNHVTSPALIEIELSELEVVPADFTLDSLTGQLVVTSDPAGAAIWIDGDDTGQVTPATIGDLSPGTIVVSLLHPQAHFSPSEFSVEISSGEQTELPSETFNSRSRRTILLEGFSNVNCQGCPTMADNVQALMDNTDFGFDRVIYVKFSPDFPSAHDPHYLYNSSENNDRYYGDYVPTYSYFSLPALMVNGTMAGTGGNPPDLEGMKTLVNEGTNGTDPGFLIDVTADFSSTSVPVTVTITPAMDVDLSGHSLFVALVQSEVHYEEAQGTYGGTDFHWVFRDRVDNIPALGALTEGTPLDLEMNLSRDDWDLNTLQVIAFVKNDTSGEVLQAGATMISSAAPLAISVSDNNNNLIAGPGGTNP